MKDTFKSFSSADYIEGACLTLDNAKKHFKASELLFQDNNTGIAVSHLILAAEEYIKSFILLCLNGEPNLINDDEKVELFRNHKFKHKHIHLFLKAISKSEASKFEQEFFDRFVNNLDDPSIYSMDGHYINNVYKLLKVDDETLLRLEEWLKAANDTKNNGFYLGVDENWRSPETFGPQDFQRAVECVQILKDAIEPLFEMPLTDEEFLKYLNREY